MNNIRMIPDGQVLAEKKELDSTGKYIETVKSKSYKYKVKLIKKGLKVVNKEGLLLFTEISMNSGKAILPIMNLILSVSDRENILRINNREDATAIKLAEYAGTSRNTVSKYLKKLIDNNILKKEGKKFMLNPFIFYPYVSDVNLKILQEYWDHDFKKSKELIGSEIQLEINKMLEDAQDFIGVSKVEFEKLKEVKNIT